MILSDFLSRQKVDDSNPHEIIPISFFYMRDILQDGYCRIKSERVEDKHMVQTRSQAIARSTWSGQGFRSTHKTRETDSKTNSYTGRSKDTNLQT